MARVVLVCGARPAFFFDWGPQTIIFESEILISDFLILVFESRKLENETLQKINVTTYPNLLQ